ncbi:Gfo/Idh/MocA family oxidoreductase [Haloechinothrix sp. LS1_15]|uniref:Gfo/Idh/MocA family protein n=1 Tax=Haloechinothrix sp. LS1_15 TaxID=2652248 RepID=UPI002945E008|nr:Gfo/Idh/MocA family oxidoreductase [Haloechinothrix sp. LS1_15]MDV6013789.1 Gfo/Idh/MocA family oxidoreductase [Haloechinothrix sp. LS1_15]
MTHSTRLALIGCGKQMRKNLLPFLRRAESEARAVVCVDPDTEQARRVQAVTGAPHRYTSVADLDLGSIDAAIVAVPPEPSADIAEKLVHKGIHCFVEKPAGPSTERLRQVAVAAEEVSADVRVQVGFNFRYADAIRRLHEVSAAARAQPCSVEIEFFSRHPSAPQWKVPTAIESWIRQNGVHAFDLAQWFVASPIERVVAHELPGADPDRFMAIVGLYHANGSHTTLRVGNQTKRFVVNATVHAADGSVYTAQSLERVELVRDGGIPSGARLFAHKPLDHGWGRSGFGPELQEFLQACAGTSWKPTPGLRDALSASMLCDLALEDLTPPSTADSGTM